MMRATRLRVDSTAVRVASVSRGAALLTGEGERARALLYLAPHRSDDDATDNGHTGISTPKNTDALRHGPPAKPPTSRYLLKIQCSLQVQVSPEALRLHSLHL